MTVPICIASASTGSHEVDIYKTCDGYSINYTSEDRTRVYDNLRTIPDIISYLRYSVIHGNLAKHLYDSIKHQLDKYVSKSNMVNT